MAAKKKRRGGVFDPSVIYVNFTRKQLKEYLRKLRQHLKKQENENNRS